MIVLADRVEERLVNGTVAELTVGNEIDDGLERRRPLRNRLRVVLVLVTNVFDGGRQMTKEDLKVEC